MSEDIVAKVREVLAQALESPTFLARNRDLIADLLEELRRRVLRRFHSIELSKIDRRMAARLLDALTSFITVLGSTVMCVRTGCSDLRNRVEKLQEVLGAIESWLEVGGGEALGLIHVAYPRLMCPPGLTELECAALYHLMDLGDGATLTSAVHHVAKVLGVDISVAQGVIESLRRKGFIAFGYSPLARDTTVYVIRKPGREVRTA